MALAPSCPALDRFVARAGELYSLPAVAMRVLELTSSPKVDVRELKRCIENDPALTTRVLRVVNSSLFGLPREVSDLNQALALLGIKPLKLLVLGFSLPDGMFAGVEAAVLERYWRRALTRGVAARELCDSLWQRDGDEAFIAGLLFDVGILVLVRDLGEPYVRFLDRVYAERRDLAALERDSLGFTHVDLSSGLLERWNLPESIVKAVAASQRPGETGDLAERVERLASVLRLADLLTAVLVDRRREALVQLMEHVRRQHGWSNDQVASLVADLEAKVVQLADVLSLSLPDGSSYADVLAGAQRQLATTAEAVVPDVVRADRARAAAARDGDEFDDLYEQTRSLTAAMQEFLADGGRTAKDAATQAAAGQSRATRADAPRSLSRPTFAAPSTAVVLEPAFEGRLSAAAAACRTLRQPLSLVLVAIDRLGELAFALGPANLPKAAELVAAVCRKVDHPTPEFAAVGDGVWALLLADCDRNQAVTHASGVVAAVHRIGQSRGADAWAMLGTSAGVATVSLPPRNFSPHLLVEKASRCLYAAQASGGNVVKSIEIY